jgi:TRAP-type mannitol/chloroaromatic compound transport system substrate-binding protein
MVTASAIGGAAAALATPAIVQATPQIKWRMASSFPNSLPTLYGGAEFLCDRIAAATDNRFQIRPFPAGEIAPALQVLDAVQHGSIECGQTAPYYYVDKDPTFGFACTVPFGLNTRQQQAWMVHGGGLTLINEFMKAYNAISFVAGNTGAQMGGWFRQELKTPDDMRGLRFRIAGLAGQVIARLGGVPQQIAANDIHPALEKGTIDAAEWVGPYDDERLGLNKIAKYYYYPGWWEGNAQIAVYVNLNRWASLPAQYKAVFEAACAEANNWMLAKYDAENPAALRRLVANGAQLRPFSREMMQAAYTASFEVYDDIAATNANFKKVYEAWQAFRADEYLWFRVAENTFENFVYTQTAVEAARKG